MDSKIQDLKDIARKAVEYRTEGAIVGRGSHTVNRQKNIDDFILKSIETLAETLALIEYKK